MDSHVGCLSLRIRAPAARPEDVAPLAEAFAARVLRRCDDILSSRAPGRIIIVRSFDIAFRVFDGTLTDEGEIDTCAEEVADALDARARTAGEDGNDDAELVAFRSESDWRAAHLEARAAGVARRWTFQALEGEAEPLAEIARDRALLLDVLHSLHRRGTLQQALAAVPEQVLADVARTLGKPQETVIERDDTGPKPPASVVRALESLGPTPSLDLAWVVAVTVLQSEAAGSGGDVEAAARSAIAALQQDAGAHAQGRATDVERIDCAFGGIFYLLRVVLELSLAESLWRACVPEQVVLSRAVATLLGNDAMDDPAPLLFSGARPTEPLPLVSQSQQEEVGGVLLARYVDMVTRRGLAEYPEPILQVVRTDHGALLTATDGSRPFVLFAHAARSPAEIVDGVEAFLSIWPASAPRPFAEAALVDLDRRGRLRHRQRSASKVNPILAEGESLPAIALVTQAAGTLAAVFAARADLSGERSAESLVQRYFTIPARVIRGTTMEVRLPLEHIDLDVRRAGLDADPGWIPWLERRVDLIFDPPPGPPEQ